MAGNDRQTQGLRSAIVSASTSTWLDLARYESALEALEQVLQISPQLAMAWQFKTIALSNLGRHDEALETESIYHHLDDATHSGD